MTDSLFSSSPRPVALGRAAWVVLSLIAFCIGVCMIVTLPAGSEATGVVTMSLQDIPTNGANCRLETVEMDDGYEVRGKETRWVCGGAVGYSPPSRRQ